MFYGPLIPLIFTLPWLMENYHYVMTQSFLTEWIINEYYDILWVHVRCLRSFITHFHELFLSYKCNLAEILHFNQIRKPVCVLLELITHKLIELTKGCICT